MSRGPLRNTRRASLLVACGWLASAQWATPADAVADAPEIVLVGHLDNLQMYKAAEEIRDADVGEVAIGGDNGARQHRCK